MPKTYLLRVLVVIFLTLLAGLWIVRDRVCEIRINQGANEYAALMNCEFKS